MATKYIVTQLWSPRHIVTRGFGTFIDQDFGQAEIIELGNARFGRNLTLVANVTKQCELEAYVLSSPTVEVER